MYLPFVFRILLFTHLVLSESLHVRDRRALIKLFSDEKNSDFKTGNESPIVVGTEGVSSPLPSDNWLKFMKHQTGRVLEGATDIALTPVQWLAHMRTYW